MQKKQFRSESIVPQEAESTSPDLSSIEGYVETISRREAVGWVWCRNQPDLQLEVVGIVAGQVVGRTVANRPRADVASSGRGLGRCGFELRFDGEQTSQALPEVYAQIGDETFLIPSTPTARANNSDFEGRIELLDRRRARGWAWLSSAPHASLTVEVFRDGYLVASTLANLLRADVAATGRGTGAYGFELSFDPPLDGFGIPTFRVRGAGVDETELTYEGTLEAERSEEIEGYVDRLDRRYARGWAWFRTRPERTLTVDATIDGRAVGSAIANEYRGDLASSGTGSGFYGFCIEFTEAITPSRLPVIRASHDAWFNEVELPESVIELDEERAGLYGHVDFLSANRAIGWAKHLDREDAVVVVRVVHDEIEVASAPAQIMRHDLRSAGHGTGKYGFDVGFQLPADAKGNIEVRIELGDASRTILVSDEPLSARKKPVQISNDNGSEGERTPLRIDGGVDSLSRFRASGWAWAPSMPEASVHVEAVVGERVIGRTIANIMRKDLLHHGLGTGLYGFELRFETPPQVGEEVAFRTLLPAAAALRGSVVVNGDRDRPTKTATESTASSLVLWHQRFTSQGPLFEEHDPNILATRPQTDGTPPLLIAFYLPQFHSIEENDSFWGVGFTEWRQLPRALSRFPGHYQPRIPRDLGFYNLTDLEQIRSQVRLAKSSGIGAFAFYYYWFNGKRVLERPLELLLQSDVDMPLMLIWANENWTRTWDGSERQILLRQDYLAEDEFNLLDDFARHFADPRYVRIAGRPLFVIYNPSNIPDARESISRWRQILRERHDVEPLIYMCQAFGARDPREYGLDGALEFPPHKLAEQVHARPATDAYSPEFSGQVINYDDFVAASLDEMAPEYSLIKTVVPSWDNDARRPNRGMILEDIAPGKYEYWLKELIVRAVEKPILGTPIVAINAWNEWAESAYLEPDVYYGSAFLNATSRAIVGAEIDRISGSERVDSFGIPKVSVVVPNFNHERYLADRLGSIVAQSVRPDEIIFLDDFSTDRSVEVAEQILASSGIDYQIVRNSENSGSVFRQWMKGIALTRNSLVWIAESDDSAHPNFLKRILPAFSRDDVMAAFGRISCIDADGAPRSDLANYFDGMEHFAWHQSGTVTAYTAFEHDFTVKNAIPNASGLVFRKPLLTTEEVDRLLQYRFAGDWYFYALLLRGGSVAYQHRARSYFRIASSSASRSSFYSDRHVREHAMILEDVRRLYAPTRRALDAHVEQLAAHFPDRTQEDLRAVLVPDIVSTRRPLRVCIAAHGFEVGGGELLPIELANALKARGHHVTYFVVEREPPSGKQSLRGRLRSDIPVADWVTHRDDMSLFIASYGIEVFNSHNLSIESNLCSARQSVNVPYVASLHGSYESAPEYVTPLLLDFVRESVDLWLYLSEKNLTLLSSAGIASSTFEHSFNALPALPLESPDRESFRRGLNIAADAFVMVICSRAIKEKGWQTAIGVTRELARRARNVHLVLIGDGPDLNDIKESNSDVSNVSFLGHVDRPMRLFSCFDLGVFPSVFSGETFPLFLLECFQVGLPVVATNVGEIPTIMGEDEFARPGAMVNADEPVSEIVNTMVERIERILDDPALLDALRRNAKAASERFSMNNLVALYERVFYRLTDSAQALEAIDLADTSGQ